MSENTSYQRINLDELLAFPPEEVLKIIAYEISRHANSIEGFAVILSKEEFQADHNYAIGQIESQAKITKHVLDIIWEYLSKRGYMEEIDDEAKQ